MRVKEHIKLLLYKFVRQVFRIIFAPFPLQDQVFFLNFSGKCYADNPKYISLKLHELYPQYKQVWARYPGYHFETPDYIKVVNWGSFKMMHEMATSKVLVSSHWLRLWMPKKKNQYYIQTWHGGLGFKKIEEDIANELSRIEIAAGRYNARTIDLLISNSAWLTDIYHEAFWGYEGEIMECGYPKAEMFYKENGEKVREVKEKLGIPSDAKILLYAPTFRKGEQSDIELFKFDYKRTIKTLVGTTRDKRCFLLRLHPVLTQYSSELFINAPWFKDVSDYDDMQELTLATDLFLTDYSSGIFDFALSNKPGLLYTPDLNQYITERGLYFDLHGLPFPLCQTEDELITAIERFDIERYQEELNNFLHEVGLIRSQHSAEKIVERIREKIEANK